MYTNERAHARGPNVAGTLSLSHSSFPVIHSSLSHQAAIPSIPPCLSYPSPTLLVRRPNPALLESSMNQGAITMDVEESRSIGVFPLFPVDQVPHPRLPGPRTPRLFKDNGTLSRTREEKRIYERGIRQWCSSLTNSSTM